MLEYASKGQQEHHEALIALLLRAESVFVKSNKMGAFARLSLAEKTYLKYSLENGQWGLWIERENGDAGVISNTHVTKASVVFRLVTANMLDQLLEVLRANQDDMVQAIKKACDTVTEFIAKNEK
jgi:hypothetical protein